MSMAELTSADLLLGRCRAADVVCGTLLLPFGRRCSASTPMRCVHTAIVRRPPQAPTVGTTQQLPEMAAATRNSSSYRKSPATTQQLPKIALATE